MKCAFVLLIVCLAAAQSYTVIDDTSLEDNDAKYRGLFLRIILESCIDETGVDHDYLKREKYGEEIDDHKLKCFHLCVGTNMKFLNPNGTGNRKKVIDYVPRHISPDRRTSFKLNRDLCLRATHKDPCEAAATFVRCMSIFRKPPEHLQ